MGVDNTAPWFKASRIGSASGLRPGGAPNPKGLTLAEIAPAEPWMGEGLCLQVGDADLWFPDSGESAAAAKKVCKGCSVVEECLRYASRRDERFGVWGATTAFERRRMRRAA